MVAFLAGCNYRNQRRPDQLKQTIFKRNATNEQASISSITTIVSFVMNKHSDKFYYSKITILKPAVQILKTLFSRYLHYAT